jgi:MFS family permease
LPALVPREAITRATALLYAMGLAGIATVTLARRPPNREAVTLRTLFAGIAFVFRRRILLGTLSLDLFAVLLGGATALLPVYAKDILQAGPWALGLLRAAPAFGAILMALALARYSLRGRIGRQLFAALFIFGVATVAFGVSTSIPLSVFALAAVGFLAWARATARVHEEADCFDSEDAVSRITWA